MRQSCLNTGNTLSILINKIRLFLFATFIFTILLPHSSIADDYEVNIKILSDKLETNSLPQAKAKTHVFLARNYFKKGDTEEAINNYLLAISLNNAAWIWMEMGQSCLKAGKYEQAKDIAESITIAFPKFSPKEIASLHKKAAKLFKKQQLEEHSPTILYVTEAEKKLSRHDLIKQKKLQAAKQSKKKRDAAKEKNLPGLPDIIYMTDLGSNSGEAYVLKRIKGTNNYRSPKGGPLYRWENGGVVNTETDVFYHIEIVKKNM